MDARKMQVVESSGGARGSRCQISHPYGTSFGSACGGLQGHHRSPPLPSFPQHSWIFPSSDENPTVSADPGPSPCAGRNLELI